MLIPSVMFVEIAVDTLKTRDADFVAKELKEFGSLGEPSKKAPEGRSDLEHGYLLGLETARALSETGAKL